MSGGVSVRGGRTVGRPGTRPKPAIGGCVATPAARGAGPEPPASADACSWAAADAGPATDRTRARLPATSTGAARRRAAAAPARPWSPSPPLGAQPTRREPPPLPRRRPPTRQSDPATPPEARPGPRRGPLPPFIDIVDSPSPPIVAFRSAGSQPTVQASAPFLRRRLLLAPATIGDARATPCKTDPPAAAAPFTVSDGPGRDRTEPMHRETKRGRRHLLPSPSEPPRQRVERRGTVSRWCCPSGAPPRPRTRRTD